MNNTSPGKVYLIGAGPGDPGLITVRGAACLQQADVVVFDRLISRRLLAYAPQAELVDVGKMPNHHPVPQEQINQRLIELAQQGKIVARLKGGDPLVFGRGGEEAQALAAAGVGFEIVPGITSAIAVPAYAGIPVTFRNLACSVAFITGHRAECADDQESEWRRAAQAAETLVFLMGVHNLPRIVEQLIAGGRAPQTPVALIQQGTHTCQQTVTGTLADIVSRAAHIKPPAIIVVGEVVSLRAELNWFERPLARPLLGLRVINTRPISRVTPISPGISEQGRDEFSRRLAEAGAEPFDLPSFIISPNPDPADLDLAIEGFRDGTTWDWLLFTSANAVHAFFARFFELELDLRMLFGVQIGVVGTASAQALEKYHLRADFIPRRFTGADLAAELPVSPGQRALIPRSSEALPDLAAGLEERGLQVSAPVAYLLNPGYAEAEVLELIRRGQAEVVTFFSPSAVGGLENILKQGGLSAPLADILQPFTIACVGPTTAQAAQKSGLKVEIVPEAYTAEALVEALIQWHARS